MAEKNINTEKEKLVVREFHDREGHTEKIILEENEIVKIVKEWDEKNSVKDLLVKEGLFRYSQTFGVMKTIEIDTSNGSIVSRTHYPNQYSGADSFFIVLVGWREIDFSDHDCCEGDDMTVTVTAQFLIDNINTVEDLDDIDIFLSVEKIDGKYKINWWDNNNYIEAEDFVNIFMKEKWEEWKENYENWLLEDIPIDYNTITEFYNEVRDIRDIKDYESDKM